MNKASSGVYMNKAYATAEVFVIMHRLAASVPWTIVPTAQYSSIPTHIFNGAGEHEAAADLWGRKQQPTKIV